jgi:hypothetical protein
MNAIGKTLVVGAIVSTAYLSGKFAYDYKTMNNANQIFDKVAQEKTIIYNRIDEINKLMPIVKESVQTEYNSEKSKLLEQAVTLDKQFLDANQKKQVEQEKSIYSWAAYFM